MPKIRSTRQPRSSSTASNSLLSSKSTSPRTTPLPGRRPKASVRLQRVDGHFSRNPRHRSNSSSDMDDTGISYDNASAIPSSPGRLRARRRGYPLELPNPFPPNTTFHAGAICAGEMNFPQIMTRGTSDPVAYVDKTLAIRIFVNLQGSHLLLRPRRSGKSTLIQMLQYFLESDHAVDAAVPDCQPEKRLCRMRAMNLDVFEESSGWNWQDHFAHYPVIHLDFKTFRPDSYLERLRMALSKYWKRWEQLLRGAGLSKNQLDTLDRWTCADRHRNRVVDDLRTCLADLIKVIHEVTGRKVVVLIDEYDQPFNITSTDVETIQATADTQKFFGSFYSAAFDNNVGLKFALLAGVSGAPAKNWNTMIDSLTVHTIDKKPETPNSDLSYVAMLTESDVMMFHKSVLGKPESSTALTMDDLGRWYRGYETYSGLKLYNPFSISRALAWGKTGPYWTATGAPSEIVSVITKASRQTRSDLVKLATGATEYIEPISTNLKGSLPSQLSPETVDADGTMYALLVHAGYLSIKSSGSAFPYVQIPNHEILVGFWKRWLGDLTEKF